MAALPCRYDASKTVDMKGRAEVAFQAMNDAMKGLELNQTTAGKGADAAADAYDVFAGTI